MEKGYFLFYAFAGKILQVAKLLPPELFMYFAGFATLARIFFHTLSKCSASEEEINIVNHQLLLAGILPDFSQVYRNCYH